MTIEEQIISKTKNQGEFGAMLNYIQDVAEEVLTEREWDAYLEKANNDTEQCEEQDGILLNGEYFDWRQFKSQRFNIVKAYLRYFNQEQLNKILKAI